MEPATQFSTVPYSLMDIQLPESPGNVKSKSTSDSVESDSVNNTEEIHPNGIDSTDIKRSNEKSELKASEKVCSSDNDAGHEKSDELAQPSKESKLDDSKLLETRSQSKKKENDYRSSRSKVQVSDRKTRKSRDDAPIAQESRSKSKERKRTRRSSEDSPSRRRSSSRDKAHKLKEDSHNRRDSRSRSKDKDRRTRKYEKDSDTHKVSRSRRDSRSRSKEVVQKTRKSSKDSKSRKAVHSRRKSRSTSNESKSDHSSDSEEEIQKQKDKSKDTRQKRRDRKRGSDSDSDKSSSSSSDSSSERKGRSARQKDRHRSRDSSNGGHSSRSRSPAKKKQIKRSDEHTEFSAISKHSRRRSKDNNQNSSRSRDSSPIQKKSRSKPVEKLDKQKETSHKAEFSDSDKVPKSPSHEGIVKKKSKIHSSEFQTFPVDESEKMKEHKLGSSEDEGSKSRSRESSPVNKPSKNKSLEQDADLVKTSKTKRSESSEGSRSQSREKSPSQNKTKDKTDSPADNRKACIFEEESKNRSSKSRSRSRELSPMECEPPSKSAIPTKTSRQEKEPESKNSDDNQSPRSRSREGTPVQTVKGSNDESSIDSTAISKRLRPDSPVEDQDSRSRSREKSPDVKRAKISFDKPSDTLDASRHPIDPAKTVSENSIPGAIKKGNITIVRKEPVKQKLKIKRDNVVISSQSKREEKENKSEKPENSESSEENQKEPVSAPVRAQYVSRKITLSSRSQSVTSDDEPKNKRSKWGKLASSQKSSATINISTDSLKNWFPDIKLMKDPAPEEPSSLPKEENDMEISANKTEEDSKQVLIAKRYQEPQREIQMEVDPEESGPVSKILFIQNLVRPFTLNQLKELLRETGNFIEEDFWIDKIKSKCFVTYETEDEAVKTRNNLNGTRWPSSNPKILSVEFSNEEELALHQSGNDAPKPVLQPVPEPNDIPEFRASLSVEEFRKKDHDQDRKRDRSKQQPPVREWDKDKITQESPDRERLGKDTDKSKYFDKKEKKDSKRKANEDTPAKLLDDLFQKTKSSPCIYWLPLTDEQVEERMESRRVRRLEREKQNQQREQEEAINKGKRPRSRNRTREAETRRSSTRSRSPVTRRR